MWGFLRWCSRWLKKELVVFYIGWSIHWSRKSIASEINSYQRSVCISVFCVSILNFLSSSVIKNYAIVGIFLPFPQKGRKIGKGTALSRSVLKLFFPSAPEPRACQWLKWTGGSLQNLAGFTAMKGPWMLHPTMFGLYICYCCTYATIDVLGLITRKKVRPSGIWTN